MKIKNTTTGEIVDLVYAPNGCDALPDIINRGSFISMSGEDISWWQEWIENQKEFDKARQEAREKLNSEERDELEALIEKEINWCDMEDQPKRGILAIKKFLQNL
jgi:hypothetical protein